MEVEVEVEGGVGAMGVKVVAIFIRIERRGEGVSKEQE